MAESIRLSDDDVRTVCEKDIKNNIAWLKKISPHQKKLLRQYLLNLDASERIDFTTERSKDICRGVEEIIRQICQNIAERDSRFKGNLVPMGSAHNDTKIGDFNEFDYVYQLQTHVLLNGKGTFCRYRDRNIIVNFASDADYKLCKPFVTKTPAVFEDGSSYDENPDSEIRLDTDHIHKIFCNILNDVLTKLELPPGWCHGGFNRPTFSGRRRNGIARLLQFDYMGTDKKAHLRLSVDFVPMIGIPGHEDVRSTFEGFIKKITGIKDSWFSLSSGEFFNNYAEEVWLTQYSSDAMPKTVMRIGKVLGELLKINYKRAIPNWVVEDIITKRQLNNSDMGHPYTYDYVIDPDEHVTYSDVGEIVKDNCLVKSYLIKRILMNMMMVSDSHGHKWTENDLPDLVICVYMILADALVLGRDRVRRYEFLENKLSVPLEDNSEIIEGQDPADSNLKYAYTYVLEKSGVIDDIRPILSSEIQPLQLSRISAVFQLLRSVCEGHDTAEIVMHKAVNPRGQHQHVKYVTKEEYKEMLKPMKPKNPIR